MLLGVQYDLCKKISQTISVDTPALFHRAALVQADVRKGSPMKPDGATPVISTLSRNPFSWLPDERQRTVFLCAALLAMILMAAIHWSNAPLQNPAAPLGMISLQLAGTLPAAKQILDSWGPQGQIWAALNLGIDYLYMVAYAATLSLACVLLARHLHRSRRVALLGVCLSWGILAALFLDAVENLLLIRLLFGDLRELWPVLALWCAVPKFGLVLATLLYLVLGGLVCLTRGAEGKGREASRRVPPHPERWSG